MGTTVYFTITVISRCNDTVAKHAQAELRRWDRLISEHEELQTRLPKEEYDALRLYDSGVYDREARKYLEDLAGRTGRNEGREGVSTYVSTYATGVRSTFMPSMLEDLKPFFFALWTMAVRDRRGEIDDWDGPDIRNNVVMIYQHEDADHATAATLRIKHGPLIEVWDEDRLLRLDDLEVVEHEEELPFSLVGQL